ncbi:class I SAM-dependent methyltransferase [Marinoscillum furvescens]|uniref:Methyltransferase family protein n=1 Tax=Marinoscillum furvescens DSM 4134 TaxID=1122208 RepID=A0A3D9L370_MARFU|nr:class I SAM-dependent methyltransferase [Marinoscillum furvescens]RED99726.1 methyltransferase family protein [Marinoscillum furvescens DSM 4134]
MSVYTTEITSDQIPSDNPIHQRLLKAYHVAAPMISGDLLELGCGEGRGVELLMPKASSYLGLDKIEEVVQKLSEKHPEAQFESSVFPPIKLPDNSFDTVVSFQVIEHIKQDEEFLKEIHRILKPGGKALISTPNIKMTLSRNPWHIREYTAEELEALAGKYFDHVDMKGIAGNEKVMQYHEQNRESVQKIMKYDVLNLQYRLPAAILRKPYEILNRRNRNKLKDQADELVLSIGQDDYFLNEKSEQNLDLFCILTK